MNQHHHHHHDDKAKADAESSSDHVLMRLYKNRFSLYVPKNDDASRLLNYTGKKHITNEELYLKEYYNKVAFATISTPQIRAPKYYLDIPHIDTGIWITLLYVEPKYRHKGYGSSLLNGILEVHGKQQKHTFLEPMPEGDFPRDKLVTWYESFGFYKVEHSTPDLLLCCDPKCD